MLNPKYYINIHSSDEAGIGTTFEETIAEDSVTDVRDVTGHAFVNEPSRLVIV